MPYLDIPRKCRRCGIYTQSNGGYCSKCQSINDDLDTVKEYIQLIDYTRTLEREMHKGGKK